MSMDHVLEVEAKGTLPEVIQQLFGGVSHTTEGPDDDGEFLVRTETFLAGVRAITDSHDSSTACFGINPNIRVFFFNIVLTDELDGLSAIVQVTVDWLDKMSGDAALLDYGETCMLIRKSGKLVRNSDDGLWTDDELKLIKLSHTVEAIPLCN